MKEVQDVIFSPLKACKLYTLQEIDPLHILCRYLSIVVGICCCSGAQDFISSFKTCKLLTKKNDQIGTYLF